MKMYLYKTLRTPNAFKKMKAINVKIKNKKKQKNGNNITSGQRVLNFF